MGLSKELIQQFVDVTNDIQERNSETFVLATAVVSDGKTYVKIDGSEILTPVKSTTKLNEGDRVTVMIKNHTATVTGNITSPSVDSGEVENKIDEFGTIIAKDIIAQNGKIDNLISENVIIKETLTAVNADIENLVAENVEITGKLEANEAEINEIKVGKLDADTAEITYATIESLKATNIEVNNIKGEFADFSQLTAEDLNALNASIKKLDAEKLNVEDAEIKFANIDFSNIGMAAIKELFAQSGIIKDLTTENGTITGELVGVTIKGDLIEAETLVADKLVVKGEDGLYYKLNVSGNKVESEQTEYNSLNGSIITAKSITATKISVSDLVAFDATIGGFKITDNSIYSGVKESANNSTRGIYLDNTGQVSFGDANNFMKFFKDADDKWKLAISANTIKLSASNSDLESTIDDIKNKVQNTTKSIEEQFAASDNPTTAPTTGWSTTPPVWQNGKYIWSKTVTTYTDGRTVESNPVCITGAKGENGSSGSSGKGIKTITNYYLATNVNTGVTDATSGWTETVQTITASKKYLWNYEKVTYTDDSSTKTIPVIIGVYGDKGQTGSSGSNGQDGVGIKSISEKYAVSSSNTTAPSTWHDTVQTMTATNKYLWNYEIVTYTNNTTSETSKRVIGAYGDKGATGATGATGKGIKSVTNYYLATNVNSGVTDATSGWTTTIQSLTSTNKYLWNYELITYTDNSTTKTTPLVIGVYGDKGQNGATGATGNGIKNITEKYAVSTSNTTAPTTWFNEVQVMTATNKYLWNYEIITYTNGGTSETSKRVIGVYGDKGATGATGPAGAAGVGIKSVDVEYYLSTSSTSQTGGSWTTTAPTWVDGKYIWTRTKTVTTDNKTTTTSPVCITGGKGSTGSVGQGVESITEEYYLSTSKTTQTGGSWVTTPPTWSKGKYMWTRSKIVYKNPTSTAYTKPVCDNSWEAVNDVEKRVADAEQKIEPGKITATVEEQIQKNGSTVIASKSYVTQEANKVTMQFKDIVATNMLLNGRPMVDLNGWNMTYSENIANDKSISLGGLGGENWNSEEFRSGIWWTGTYDTSGTWCCLFNRTIWQKKFSTRKKYSISAVIYCKEAENVNIRICDGNGSNLVADKQFGLSEGYQLVQYEFTPATTGNIPELGIYLNTKGAFEIYIPWIVVKEGSPTNYWISNGNEIREGSTVIDSGGVTINNGAITIKNRTGQTVLRGDVDGNLSLTGSLVVSSNKNQILRVDTADAKFPHMVIDSYGPYMDQLSVCSDYAGYVAQNAVNGVFIRNDRMDIYGVGQTFWVQGSARIGHMVTCDGSFQGQDFSLGETAGDRVLGSPWYGLGRSTNTSGGGRMVQLSGYFGLLFKTMNNTISIPSSGGINITGPDLITINNNNNWKGLDLYRHNCKARYGIGSEGTGGSQNFPSIECWNSGAGNYSSKLDVKSNVLQYYNSVGGTFKCWTNTGGHGGISIGDTASGYLKWIRGNSDIQCRNYADNAYTRINASVFVVNSQEKAKENIVDLDSKKAINILMTNEIKVYNLINERNELEQVDEEANEKGYILDLEMVEPDNHCGLILDHLTEEATDILQPGRTEGIDVYAMASILWKVCQEQQNNILKFEERINTLESLLISRL